MSPQGSGTPPALAVQWLEHILAAGEGVGEVPMAAVPQSHAGDGVQGTAPGCWWDVLETPLQRTHERRASAA